MKRCIFLAVLCEQKTVHSSSTGDFSYVQICLVVTHGLTNHKLGYCPHGHTQIQIRLNKHLIIQVWVKSVTRSVNPNRFSFVLSCSERTIKIALFKTVITFGNVMRNLSCIFCDLRAPFFFVIRWLCRIIYFNRIFGSNLNGEKVKVKFILAWDTKAQMGVIPLLFL